MGLSISTNPAARGAEVHGLGVLAEGSECGSDDGCPRRKNGRSPKWSAFPPLSELQITDGYRRESGIASIATSRSPIPFAVRQNAVQPRRRSITPDSPTVPSPSPKKTGKSPGPKKHKRRRESGMLQLPSRADLAVIEATESSGPIKSKNSIAGIQPILDDSRVSDLLSVETTTTSNTSNSCIQAKDSGSTSRGSSRAYDEPSISQTERTLLPVPEHRTSHQRSDAVYADGTSIEGVETEYRSTSIVAPSPAPSAAASVDDDANGGRRGRARKSVNYKEPSLTKYVWHPGLNHLFVGAESDQENA